MVDSISIPMKLNPNYKRKAENFKPNFRRSTSNCVGLIPLIDDLFRHLEMNYHFFDKVITSEAFRYYAAALLWMRVVHFKAQCKREMRDQTKFLFLNSIEFESFTVRPS